MTEIASSLVYQVSILFLMMAAGFLLGKCRLAPDGFGKGLSGLVLYIAQPALVFLAYLRPFDASVLSGLLWTFVFSIVAHLIFAVAALCLFRGAPEKKRKMLRMATVFSNAAFMGIPLIAAILDQTAVLYATVYNITFNLVLWSLGVYICKHEDDLDGDGDNDADDRRHARRHSLSGLGRALLHPVTLAAALGLCFFFLPIDGYVPALVTDALSMLKATVAPLSMMVIGIRLSSASLRGFFRDKYLYLFLAMRHFVLPLAVLALLRLAALVTPAVDSTVTTVVLILAAAPAASSATMFAERYDCDASYVGSLVTVSTLLSLLSMPLLLLLAGL